METYTAREKDELLRRYYYGMDSFCNTTLREILCGDGYIEYHPNLMQYFITDKGKSFILQGGYSRQEEKEQAKLLAEKERMELTRLQKEELMYKRKIRRQEDVIRIHKFIEAVLGLISIGLGIAFWLLN